MSVSYNTKVVTNGLVMYLDAANTKSYPGSGTTWTDLSNNGNNTMLVNGPTFTNLNGGAIVFDGINDYCSSVSIPNPNGQLTCEIVMNYNNKGVYQNIFDNNSNRPMLWIDPFNKIEVSFASPGGVTSTNSYNGQNIHVCAIYNSNVSPGIQLYVNGYLTNQLNSSHVSWSSSPTFTLFNRSNSQTFSGNVYLLKFYNRALSASEINQNFNAIRGRYGI